MSEKDRKQQPDTPEVCEASETPEAAGEAFSAEDYRNALEIAIKQRDEYLTMAQRGAAEFANYKKRNESARAEATDEGIREAASALLPTIDNLDRAIEAAKGADEHSALLEGVEMTRRILFESLGKLGLEEVPAEGEVFDPEMHNAIMRADEGEPGMILEVFQRGYRIRGKIIRYPMVKVAAE